MVVSRVSVVTHLKNEQTSRNREIETPQPCLGVNLHVKIANTVDALYILDTHAASFLIISYQASVLQFRLPKSLSITANESEVTAFPVPYTASIHIRAADHVCCLLTGRQSPK
jgi:hypothetical protein